MALERELAHELDCPLPPARLRSRRASSSAAGKKCIWRWLSSL